MSLRPKSWPSKHRSKLGESFVHKSCEHIPSQNLLHHPKEEGIYDNVFKLSMSELLQLQKQHVWLPYSVGFYSTSQLRQMTWAGRLLVEGWDEDDTPVTVLN